MVRKREHYALLGLVFLSGAAGLLYQVVWQRYLGILLGAQARATAVVLAIFLGGICIGYDIFGRFCIRTRYKLLAVYAILEVALGAWAFLFPFLFRLARLFSTKLYADWGVDGFAVDVFVSSWLVGPPAVLMGGTLPLLTQGLSEDLASSSRTHAHLYGFNTLGACLGSCLAGYVMIPNSTLPTTLALGACMNWIVAAGVYWLGVRKKAGGTSVTVDSDLNKIERGTAPLVERIAFHSVGFLSGFYVITLETVLMRLVGLSSGASHYNFTLVLSIFVFGLGFGSLLVKRIGEYGLSRLFWNQITVAASLLMLYLTADSWPYWVHLIRVIFRDQSFNFYLFQVALGIFFLSLLAIPIGFCGLTMPLCFHLAKDSRQTLGLRVGQLYSINTLGCVMGALIGGYLALNYLNLDQLFKVCIFASLVSALAAGYLYAQKTQSELLDTAAGGVLFGLIFVGTAVAPLFTKEIFIQPFRQQNVIPSVTFTGRKAFIDYLSASSRYLFYKDGPNSTVGVGQSVVDGQERSRTLFVNGKSDGNTKGDALTMTLTAHIPGLLAPRLDRACVIGFGTGMTTGGLTRYPENKSVDVVEISNTVLEAAPLFDPYDGEVSTDPKVHFHAMDAFRFLAGSKDGFDVIISEPSNPWVAGVENLYTEEFYRSVKQRLNPDGVFVQWVQTYSFDEDLLKLVLRTMTQVFPRVSIFQMLEHDAALVAWPKEIGPSDLKRAQARWEANPAVRQSLAGVGLSRFETLLAFELVPPELTRLLPESGPLQRLESPRLSTGAARAFFAGTSTKIHTLRRAFKEYYPSVRHSLLSMYLEGSPPSKELAESFRATFCESPSRRSNILCEESLILSKWLTPKAPYESLYGDMFTETTARDIASLESPPPSKTFTRGDLLLVQRNFDFFKNHYSAIDPLPIEPIIDKLDSCIHLVDPVSGLYGDCLLQKAAVLEIATPEDPDFLRTVHLFLDWFAHLPHEHDDFARFRRAADILKSMLEDGLTKARLSG